MLFDFGFGASYHIDIALTPADERHPPMEELLRHLKFQDGLIPVVVVEADGEVLKLCYMDLEALSKTLKVGLVHVFRRSKGRVMLKGETSGHTQKVKEVRVDCEGKSLVMVVEQHVGACHLGYRSCYHRRYRAGSDALEGEVISASARTRPPHTPAWGTLNRQMICLAYLPSPRGERLVVTR